MMNTIFQSSRECWWACLIFLAAVALGSVSEARFDGLDSAGNYRIRLGLKPSTGVSCRTIVILPALPVANHCGVRGLGDANLQQVTADSPLKSQHY